MYSLKQNNFFDIIEKELGEDALLDRNIVNNLKSKYGFPFPHWFFTEEFKADYGKYKIPTRIKENPTLINTKLDDEGTIIPEIDPNYIKYGFYNDLKKIVASKEFYPVMIVGESGNGKTKMVEEVCAELKKPLVRINVSNETDETALIGGPTLTNGNIIFKEGPVLKCMREGLILLIDELCRINPQNALCLQAVLEGASFYNKHTGELIKAKPGFQIIATANSKGQGATSKYLSQILDSAFLERFCICIEQEFASEKVEIEILSKYISDKDFVEKLCRWSAVIRESYKQNAIDEIISTRRLIHIAKTYKIFNNKKKAIEYSINRFEDEVKDAFLNLYTKIDAGLDITEET